MTFYAQHGFGKADKIEHLASTGGLEGVILSPADETADSLLRSARTFRDGGLKVLLDPQLYIYTTARLASGRRHKENGLGFTGVHWSQSAGSTQAQVEAIQTLNTRLGLPYPWIAPAPMQHGFADGWASLSLQLARSAMDLWGGENTIASLVIDERSLSNQKEINDWLDVATTLPVRGFYILVERASTSYPPSPWSSSQLSNLLSLIYVLGELNDYEVTWGYSDLEGVLGLVAGATAIASGWSHGLRQFSTAKWVPRGGGTQPVSRIPIPPLLAMPDAENEAPAIGRSRTMAGVPDHEFFRGVRPTGDPVALADYQKGFLEWLSLEATGVASLSGPDARDYWSVRLDRAVAGLQGLSDEGVILHPSYVGRLRNQQIALADFITRERL